MSRKSTPAEKDHWLTYVKRARGSHCGRITAAPDYHPAPKAASAEDMRHYRGKLKATLAKRELNDHRSRLGNS